MARTVSRRGWKNGWRRELSWDWIMLNFVLSTKGALNALEVFKQVSDMDIYIFQIYTF